ncbi:MAG: Hsp70 family protein [Microcystis sp.]|uniref:Hsp70 family protein n=1 Tax=Microcystis TaxID=1125 RepID=UPI000E39FB4F|nr:MULTISPECIES: Hsp70 family protein [Microcystis]NCQ91725.1 Hsp70 family protein [Microcystis aeruginosa LG13-13]NCR04922.1 Hsp70 family protein [Microcystis aeruginosa LG13-03]NCR63160.1 Hsp70 family protein [Microcystis aeruginosa LG11-05]REJ48314.1 MAG: Hsp70 family protein [Microcystis aeruginosa TA09]MBD2287726.1 Hsp70 family protein [Microcystis wesenbergii FACHB-1317]
MGNIVGIDLGTTNSVAAFKFAGVEVVTAADNSPPERKLTRSLVSLAREGLIVGEEAYRQIKATPENVIMSIKRLMGRSFSDTIVQEQIPRLSYKVTRSSRGTEDSLSVWLGGKEYEPEDISAEILKKVVANAQNYQGANGQKSRIQEAVITIPAYFNDKQRHATEMAAKRAGIIARELLSEPTAAAISYGYKPDSEEVKTILVYDFGGGTFDSCLITAAGNQFIESGKAGDLWLGGDDLDTQLMQFVKEKVAQEEALEDVDALIAAMPHYQRVRFLGDFKSAVERAKIDLSSAESATIIPATPLIDEMGMAIAIAVTIKRSEFEEMIRPLVEKTIAICQEAIRYSDYPEDLIDVVLLVGGSSQIPFVQEEVKKVFGCERVVVHRRPMYAVAEGAAIVAAGLTEKVMTVSRDYCIHLADGSQDPIIRQGDILPVKTTRTFKTEADDQSLIHFKFYSPDRVRAESTGEKCDEKIGEMWLALDRPYPKGTEILLAVSLDEQNNSLSMVASLKNDPSLKVSSDFSRGGEDEEISRQVEESIEEINRKELLTTVGAEYVYQIAGEIVRAANQIRGEDGKSRQDRVKVAREKLRELKTYSCEDSSQGQILISEFEFVVKYCQILVPEEQQARIEQLIEDLNRAINNGNLSAIQRLNETAIQERKNLSELLLLLLLCRSVITRTGVVNQASADSMARKFGAVITALQAGDRETAERELQRLLPEVRQNCEIELPTGSVATGLTRF